jgi:hypothetical protein
VYACEADIVHFRISFFLILKRIFDLAAERVRLVVANATCIENESGMNWDEGTERIHIHRLLSKMSHIPTLKFQKLMLHLFQKLIRTEARNVTMVTILYA